MSELATRTKENAAVQKDPASKTVLDLIHEQQGAIGRALPAHLTPERFARIVLTEVRRNKELLRCDPMSLLGSVMVSAQLGLEPGPLGHVYLVPYKREVTPIIGYKGYIDLARRSGQVSSIQGYAVYPEDEFRYTLGLHPDLHHVPDDDGPQDPAKLAYSYAVAHYRDGGFNFVVCTRKQIEAARKRSQSGKNNKGPWSTDYEAMAIKTAVRRLSTWLPVSPEFAAAMQVDEQPAPRQILTDMVEAYDESGELLDGPDEAEEGPEDDGAEDAEIVYDDDDPERPFENGE